MFFMLLLFLSASTLLDAAQLSKSKIKFDVSKLHSNYRHLAYQDLTPEEYQDICRKSKIFFLADALISDDVAKIQDLIRDGVDVDATIAVDEGLRNGYYKVTSKALHVVAQWGYVRAARELLKSPTIDVDSVGRFINSTTQSLEYMTPLMLAISQAKVVITRATKKDWHQLNAAEEYEKIVELLINNKASVTTVTKWGVTTYDALLFAIDHGTPRMVEMLIAAGANIDDDVEFFKAALKARESFAPEQIQQILERVDKRNKEFIAQTEKVLVPEFLIPDLAKIVSEYVAVPITYKEK